LKVMGFQTRAASELFAVDASKVLRLAKGMSLEQGAMVEPLAVSVHALERVGGAPGRRCWCSGRDRLGNLVAQAARGLGAAAVMITDTSDYRLEVAERCGIPLRVNPLKVDLGEPSGNDSGRTRPTSSSSASACRRRWSRRSASPGRART